MRRLTINRAPIARSKQIPEFAEPCRSKCILQAIELMGVLRNSSEGGNNKFVTYEAPEYSVVTELGYCQTPQLCNAHRHFTSIPQPGIHLKIHLPRPV